MDWQIVDPDPGLNYNEAILTGGLHFKMEKYTLQLPKSWLHSEL